MLTKRVPGGLSDRVAYRAQQAWLLHLFRALHQRWGILRNNREVEVDAGTRNAIWRRYSALLERDLLNVREGLYPRALLFEIPVRAYASAVPELLRNAPAVVVRRLAQNTSDLPAGVDLEEFPSYYRRNFHWQTDGYLSRRSAALYDPAVEMLFFGTADVMRRQVIPPITRELQRRPAGQGRPRLLDVACGTGRTLHQLAATHPELSLFGLDLSPFYVEHAREHLAGIADLTLLAGNAEELPFRDGWFDVVTSTYLLHELPREVRRRVLDEIFRVLRPGGLFVLEDSAQLAEGQDIAFFMERFAREFHEPFFLDYVADDVAPLLSARGFAVEAIEPCFIAKVVTARKPR